MCEDVYKVILTNLDFRGLASLGSACWASYNAQRSLTFLHFGTVTLSPMQALIRDRVKGMVVPADHRMSLAYVRAPMGFGKTIAALAAVVAAPAGDRFAIYVPSKAVSTWSAEVTRVFAGGQTPVLVAHGSRNAHLKVVKAAINARGSLAAGAFQSRDTWLPGIKAIVIPFTAGAALQDFVHNWASRAVVDEAHSVTERGNGIVRGRYSRIVLLSANESNWAPESGEAWDHIDIGNGYMRDTIPEARVHHITIPPCPPCLPGLSEEVAFACSGDKPSLVAGNLAAYRSALLNIFLGITAGKVALYLPDGHPGDLIEDSMGEIAPGWHRIRFVGAVSKIKLFEQRRCSVLLIRETNSEALNILATHIIIVRPDWVSAERYMQLVGRVLRPTNPNAVVDAYLVTPAGTPTHRAYHYEALRTLRISGLKGLDDRYSAADLRRVDIALRLCGSALERAAASERAAAIGVSVRAEPRLARDIYALWLKEGRRTVTTAQMATMLDATEAELSTEAELPTEPAAAAGGPPGAPPDLGGYLDDLLGV